MKFLIILLGLASAVLATLVEDEIQWINFKSKHNKLYKNLQEEKLRFAIFQQNLRAIEKHDKEYDAESVAYTKVVNQFADLTTGEFSSMLKSESKGPLNLHRNIYEKSISTDVPESIDWREKGAVSEVENQGMCGVAWVFSVIGTLVGFNFVKTKELVKLSKQQLIDCSMKDGGCFGGDEGTALEYLKEYGIETEESYPDNGVDSVCRYNESEVYLRIKDFVQIAAKDEDGLLSAVGLLGPVAVFLDATDLAFYHTGIFYSNFCSPNSLNHAVLVVGYGKDEETGLDYWLVKNSWGKDWGEDGYFRIKRGVNECGIAMDCVYPVL